MDKTCLSGTIGQKYIVEDDFWGQQYPYLWWPGLAGVWRKDGGGGDRASIAKISKLVINKCIKADSLKSLMPKYLIRNYISPVTSNIWILYPCRDIMRNGVRVRECYMARKCKVIINICPKAIGLGCLAILTIKRWKMMRNKVLKWRNYTYFNHIGHIFHEILHAIYCWKNGSCQVCPLNLQKSPAVPKSWDSKLSSGIWLILVILSSGCSKFSG